MAAEQLKSSMKDLPEDADLHAVEEAKDGVVRSYGGDPRDKRQRLDNLAKYGKNELDGSEK